MPYLPSLLTLLIFLLGIRTLCWHLQCWQLREYRFDRMRAWLQTQDGKKQYFTPWLSSGLLPRPKLSGRIFLLTLISLISTLITYLIMHTGLLLFLAPCVFVPLPPNSICSVPMVTGLLTLFFVERTLWLQAAFAVLVSNLPVRLKKLHLFAQARQVIKNGDQNIIRIGITGSYGKSSTKELLVHLLKSEFSDGAVLYNPANQNTEVAIARLILKNQEFFKNIPSTSSSEPKGQKRLKFLVIETGAYKKGEIATVAKIIAPQYSILTGLNQQHIELFGSINNTRDAKFELAEGTQNTVFFNGDNPYLQQIFADRDIKATPVAVTLNAAKDIVGNANKTEFKAYGQNFILPWPGEFFVQNALLALECARELGVSPERLATHLKKLAPLERALNLSQNAQGFTVLRDTYSANPDGVLSAIAHLKNFKGRRIFVSIPLRELGGHAETIHQQIFEALKDLEAEVYWEKTDFADLGKKVLGDKFNFLDDDFAGFKTKIKTLKQDDVVLLESKLSKKILDLF